MPLTKEKKKQIIDNLKEKIDKHKSGVFVSVAKLKADDISNLRNKLKEKDCLLSVVKKTLLQIVFKEKKIDIDVKKLEGELALVLGFSDEISAPKIVNDFSKGSENLKILGGIFEKGFIPQEKVLELAQIPSQKELLSRLVGSISSPISGFVNALSYNIKGLVYILNTIKK